MNNKTIKIKKKKLSAVLTGLATAADQAAR
jgi:hypothetical protein